ncbi:MULTISPECIES: PRD domain-containing protein [Clostridia]|uniref:PRD domain-containing protein n=1 Tax=Clostridia TaxID=186801 RepID=UPI000EA3B45B|nr:MULTISPECIES: PRD domain-containing protein [Clostridia]NBJ70317.1 PRD domain-containing protein [Roseburia sp. 1XD42-34]RKI76455.1 PRD domain-containing protein [Clostridium sp. 1xD42-85]
MLKIIKSLNNNIILAKSEENEELIIFGTGIGFKKKYGDLVDESKATQIFKAEKNMQTSTFLEQISPELLAVTEKIIRFGEEKLHKKLNQSILFSLADHLQFATDKRNHDINKDNPLQWEIPYLYYEEYEVGKMAVQIIKEDLGYSLPEMEAAFIALHFVNAQIDSSSMEETIQITKLIKNIVKIIQRLFEVNIDKTTINYSRFITHLRYFIARQKMNHQENIQMDEALKKTIEERYMKSYACGLIIKEMVEKEFNWEVTYDEIAFLVIHIERIFQENR